MMDDLALMRLHADTLFTYDARGRMVRSNEPDGHPAPRLFLGVTSKGFVVRFGETVSDDVAGRLAGLVEPAPPGDNLRAPPSLLSALGRELAGHGPIAVEQAGLAYRFPDAIPRQEEVVQVTDATITVVRDTFSWLYHELAGWQPCFAVVRDGKAVSVCFSSRIGSEACEAGVETLPDFRGRGYASAVTSAWGASIRDSGRVPLYSTSWDNRASQGVARRTGLILFGSDVSWV